MAGGKQTPRQKLVGMMYLVLTALLALQVSSGVLDKFIIISDSLENAVSYQLLENNNLIKRISKTIKESGSKKSDLEVLNKLVKLRERTDKVISQIENFKLILIKKAGGTKTKLKGLRNDAVVANLMINNNRGKELKTLLNAYTTYLFQLTGKKYKPIALDARDIDFLKNDPNQGRKDFVMLNFKKTPLAAALATLSVFKSKVVYSEADCLELLARDLGGDDYKVDTVMPFVIPHSPIVASGDKYKAQVVLAAYSSTKPYDIKINGSPIPVRDGIGYIEFPVVASKAAQKNGREKRTFEVAVTMKNKKGEIDTKVIKETYEVTVPNISIDSEAVQALYRNCANEVRVSVPEYGKNYNPNFKIEGASFVHKGGGKLTITPKFKQVSLKVSQNKTYVGTKVLSVRKIPLPQIELISSGVPVNEKIGMKVPGPRTLKIAVSPDSTFKEFLPKEANYRVSKGVITLARKGKGIAKVNVTIKNATNIDMTPIVKQARNLDRIVVEIEKVVRRTSSGSLEEVDIPLHMRIRSIPITK